MSTPGDGSTDESGPDIGLEELLDRFEDAWQQGLRPRLEDYLPPGEPSPVLLAGLAQIDLERRLTAGEAVRVETYLERFPVLAEDPTQVLDLVLREHELRCELEPGVSRREYLARFPHLERQLEERLPAEPPMRIEGEATGHHVPGGVENDPASPSTALPDRLGSYELLGELGRGGMAVVHKGRDPVLRRELAVKLLHEEHQDDPARVQRFIEEAQIGGQLQHPGIVPVYDSGFALRRKSLFLGRRGRRKSLFLGQGCAEK